MSWGTDFSTKIFLSHQIYNSKFEVEEKISELESDINDTITALKMFIASTPRDIVPAEIIDDESGCMDWLIQQTAYYFESFQEDTVQLYQLRLYLEYLNEHEELSKMKSDCCNSKVVLVDHYHCNACGKECNQS